MAVQNDINHIESYALQKLATFMKNVSNSGDLHQTSGTRLRFVSSPFIVSFSHNIRLDSLIIAQAKQDLDDFITAQTSLSQFTQSSSDVALQKVLEDRDNHSNLESFN